MLPQTARRLRDLPKGDALATAQLAGIMAAKRTSELIPLCHPLTLSNIEVSLDVHEASVEITAVAETTAQTGVEMEALTAASVAALTIYDMCKAIDKAMQGIIRYLRIQSLVTACFGAAVAVAGDFLCLLQGQLAGRLVRPLGSCGSWVLFDLATVVAMAAFHPRRHLTHAVTGPVAYAVAIAVTAFGGVALAAANTISIKAPTHARVNVGYRFTVTGFAANSERLYFFNDVDKCGANPHVEHALHNANGDDFVVDGAFKEVSKGWRSPKATTYYVCAYLVKASEPFNGAGGDATFLVDFSAINSIALVNGVAQVSPVLHGTNVNNSADASERFKAVTEALCGHEFSASSISHDSSADRKACHQVSDGGAASDLARASR